MLKRKRLFNQQRPISQACQQLMCLIGYAMIAQRRVHLIQPKLPNWMMQEIFQRGCVTIRRQHQRNAIQPATSLIGCAKMTHELLLNRHLAKSNLPAICLIGCVKMLQRQRQSNQA